MVALKDTELLAWLDRTSQGWRDLATRHPEILSLPCSIRETSTVGQLLQHIVAVELRYEERLNDLPASSYDGIAYDSAAVIDATHQRAMELVRRLDDRDAAFWEEVMELATRSAGMVRASRRTVLVHLCMHSIRHYAQLATLVREHGIPPGWPMDYLFSSVV